MDFKVTIHRLLLREEKLDIAVSASGPWDENVRDPKMTIVFSNGEQTRRLPIVVRFYQSEKDGSFYLMASYTYTLKYLFYQQPKNRHIEFSGVKLWTYGSGECSVYRGSGGRKGSGASCA